MVITKGYGLTIDDIDWSCPSELKDYEYAFRLEQKMIDQHNWMLGMYVESAVGTAVEHCLAGRKAKSEYIKEAILSHQDEYAGLTQEEIDNIEIRKMIANEEAWIRAEKSKNLPETIA